MPREYRAEAKIQFPLPEDPVQYEAAITRFGVDRVRVLAEHEEWVDHEQIADIARASEAKDCQVSGGEKHPRKQGRADTAGSSIAEASTSGGKRWWKVCVYCAK